MNPRLPLSLVLCVLVLAAESADGQAPAQMFDQFARDGTTGVVSFRDTDQFLNTLKSQGQAWITAAPAAERDRRRHVLALFALEIAQTAPSTNNGLQIIEWACDLLRRQSKNEFERAWMIASASLFLRADFEQRFDLYARATPVVRPPSAMEHLDHALARFPEDSQLRLMKVLQRPEAYALASRPGADPVQLIRVPSIVGSGSGPDSRRRLADTEEQLAALSESAMAGAEARAHLGWLKFHRNELDASVAELSRAAAASEDPFVRNLAMIGSGLALGAQGKPADAAIALRQAVDALPRARASIILLAAHLFLSGNRREAADLVGDAFGPDAFDLEPWRHPLQFDRLVPALLATLRSSVGLPQRTRPHTSPSAGQVAPPGTRVINVSPTTPAEPGRQLLPSFRSTANAVVLDVLVTSGRLPVAGLTADDLEVLDNGVPQKVEAIQLDRMPIDISLVVDFFNEVEVGGFSLARKVWSPRLAERTREDMINVAAELRPTDRLRLLQVDDNLGRELWPMQSPPFPIERLPIVSNHLSETARPRATYGRMQGLYDITAAALLRQAEADRRHLVVAFTDGVDGASATPPSLLLAVARESQSAMYVARRDTQTEFAAMEGIRNVTPYRPLLWPPDPHIIERAAESTGGSVFFHPQGSLLPDFRKIFNLFRSSYVVRYQPTSQTPGWHDVTVRVVKAGKFDVKVRRGYSIPK